MDALGDLAPSYNIAPGQPILTVRREGDAREGEERIAARMRWGLLPYWAKDPSKLPPMINARIETAATSAAYGLAFRRRRCLIPADGFYEWGPGERGSRGRSPFWISLPSGDPFAMAGLWSVWRPPDARDAPIHTCTILTVDANAVVSRIHDRMPVILHPEAEGAWLDPALRDAAKLTELLAPLPPDALQATPVSPRVNSARNDGPDLIRPVPEPPTLGF
jgi:putative SOS response-associated peptidase YedK